MIHSPSPPRNLRPAIALTAQVEELTRSKSLSDLEKTTEHRVAESAKSTAKHMQKQAAISAEKASQNKGKCKIYCDVLCERTCLFYFYP